MRRTTFNNDVSKTDSQEMESSYKLEYSIETDRILKVLGQTMTKLEVALSLPLILKNEIIMNKHFIAEEQLLLQKAFSSYIHLPDPHKTKRKHESIECEMKKGINYLRERITNEQNEAEGMQSGGESIRKGSSKAIVKMNKDVFRAIDVLTSKLKLNTFVQEHLLGKISPAASIFLSYVKQLVLCAEMRLAVTHDMELANEENLYLVWGQNQKSKTDIEKLKKELEAQRAEGTAHLVEKLAIINKNQSLIERLKQHCKEDIKKRVNESERSMIYEWRGSENRQELLRSDVAELERKYQQVLSEHIVNEKDLKAKKIKVESQLVSVLARYDNDVGERQDELEEITDGFNEEKRQMAELQAKFEVQDVEYYSLMNEKETEEREEFMLRLYNFKANRAARLIQRLWRSYNKGRGMKGKKAKKGKKGKK